MSSNKKLTPEEHYKALIEMKEMWENAGGTWAGAVNKNKPKEVKRAFKKVCKDAEKVSKEQK